MPADTNSLEETQEFINRLQDEDWRERKKALNYLSYSLPQQADEVLNATFPLLEKDESIEVRREAARLIAKIGGKRAITALLAALDKEPATEAKASIVSALGTTGDIELFNKLASILKDKTQPGIMRSCAGASLGKLRDTRALELLGDALKDANTSVRMGTILGLRAIGDSRAVDLLINTLQDEDSYIRATAILGLVELKDKRAIPALEQIHDYDNTVDEYYGKLNELAGRTIARLKVEGLKTLDEFITTFREGDVATRRLVVDLLGERANPDVLDFLLTALNDPEPEIRNRVLNALGEIGDERAIPALEWVAQNDTTQISKAFTLGEIAADVIAYIKRRHNE